jgi:hypothetical protein
MCTFPAQTAFGGLLRAVDNFFGQRLVSAEMQRLDDYYWSAASVLSAYSTRSRASRNFWRALGGRREARVLIGEARSALDGDRNRGADASRVEMSFDQTPGIGFFEQLAGK